MVMLCSWRFWEVPRYCNAIRHSAEERQNKYTKKILFENGKLGNVFQQSVICVYIVKYLHKC